MKNTWLKMTAVVTAVVCFIGVAQAVPITGNIGFTGRVQLDTSTAATATQVIGWVNPSVNGTTGSFAGISDGTLVNFSAPWTFTAGLSPLWSVGGFTFNLLTSSVTHGTILGNAYVAVSGMGIVSGNSFDPTALSWSFTTQDPAVTANPQTFTFSASATSVPDNGTTVMLLGFGLLSLGLFRKQLFA
jgi:VPDSG-CTERM motif